MLISEVLPDYDFGETHRRDIAAPAEDVYRAVRALDAGSSFVTRVLLAARGLTVARRLDLQTLLDNGFSILVDEEPEELVLGVVARPWLLLVRPKPLDAEGFRAFDTPGYMKAAWNFHLEPRGPRTRVTTQTRVLCTDDRSRALFRPYWSVVRPFSGLIRTEILRAIEREATR